MNPESEISKAQSGLRTHAILTIGFLVIQFVLGMVTNLYVQFPDTTQVDKLWAFARTQLPSAAHIIIGMLLLVSAIVFVIRAARQHIQGWIVSSAAGLVGIIIAIFGGVMFTSSQNDVYSLIMALGFIAAFVAYGWGLFADRG